jgi:uncharacterized protein YbaR (Trm112 family)
MEFDKMNRVSDTKEFLELLACPKCHSELRVIPQPEGFACDACELLYPLEDGLPNMLISEARPWPDSGAPASA